MIASITIITFCLITDTIPVLKQSSPASSMYMYSTYMYTKRMRPFYARAKTTRTEKKETIMSEYRHGNDGGGAAYELSFLESPWDSGCWQSMQGYPGATFDLDRRQGGREASSTSPLALREFKKKKKKKNHSTSQGF
ncbi:hypothetical protein ACKS23_04446 [Histoplasma ohiense]